MSAKFGVLEKELSAPSEMQGMPAQMM